MIILICKRNNKFQTCYCYTLKKAVQIKEMAIERGAWNNASYGAFDLERFLCIEGAKDLVEGVLKAIRTRLFPQVSSPVSPSACALELRGHEKLFERYGIPLEDVKPGKGETTMYNIIKKPGGGFVGKLEGESVVELEGESVGQLVIDRGRRAIAPSLDCYPLQHLEAFNYRGKELEEQRMQSKQV